jgi:hypothetical protein
MSKYVSIVSSNSLKIVSSTIINGIQYIQIITNTGFYNASIDLATQGFINLKKINESTCNQLDIAHL